MKIKTKKTSRRIATGIREETYTRQGVEYIKKIYDTASLAAFREMTGGVFGEDRIKALAVWATAWLKEEGLPYQMKVYYAQLKKADTIKISDIITKAEFDEKFEALDPLAPWKGGILGSSWLTIFIEQLGHGRLDFAYLISSGLNSPPLGA